LDTDGKGRWLCFFAFCAVALILSAFLFCSNRFSWVWIQRQAIDFVLMCWFLVKALWQLAVGIFIGGLAYELWLTRKF